MINASFLAITLCQWVIDYMIWKSEKLVFIEMCCLMLRHSENKKKKNLKVIVIQFMTQSKNQLKNKEEYPNLRINV